MKKLILLSAALLAACSAGSTDTPGAEDLGVLVTEARFNPPLPGQSVGVGFMSLQSIGADDRLLSASTPVSDRIELHTHSEVGGVMKMRRVEAIDLPAGEVVALKPGSFHIMIFNADMTLGEDTTVTLDFENAPDVTLTVPVVQRGQKPMMDHGSGTDY